MKNVLAAAIAATLAAAAAGTLSAESEEQVRPNCYAEEIRIVATVDTPTADSYAFYEVLSSGEIYQMDAQDFAPGDVFIGLMCDNDTPDDIYDDWYVEVIKWLE